MVVAMWNNVSRDLQSRKQMSSSLERTYNSAFHHDYPNSELQDNLSIFPNKNITKYYKFESQIKFPKLFGIVWVFIFEKNEFDITQTLINLVFLC